MAANLSRPHVLIRGFLNRFVAHCRLCLQTYFFVNATQHGHVGYSTVHHNTILCITRQRQPQNRPSKRHFIFFYGVDWRAVVGNRPANDLSLRQVRNCVVRIFRALLANTIMQMHWQPICHPSYQLCMMPPWHRNDLHITGPLWGESIGERLIPLKKGQWCGVLM